MKKSSNHLRSSWQTLGLLVAVFSASFASASDAQQLEAPDGFGAGTTGGRGGEVVQVSSAKDLSYQLCRSYRGGICNDNEPRIIEVVGTVDFTGTEGRAKGEGCQPGNNCQPPYKTESLLLLNANDTHCDGKPKAMISFDKAGKNPLQVGSNKTVIGAGANATIRGKGFGLNGVKNVIIRNLTISDINQGVVFAGDAIAIAEADQVWIDHNRFHNIGRQMIAGGFGATTNITISWNDFDGSNVYSPYCNGQHYWNLLFLGSPQTITIADNHFHEVSGRAPHVDGSRVLVHLVNNYFHNLKLQQSNGFFHALDASAPVKVLVEGNYFDKIESPITKTGAGHVFGALGRVSDTMQNECVNGLGRKCAGNIAVATPAMNQLLQDQSVVQSFNAVPQQSILHPFNASEVPALITAKSGPGHL